MSRRQRRRVEMRRRHEEDSGRRFGRSLATGAGVTVGATVLMGGVAQAATLTVGSTADTTGSTDCAVPANTTCTLRDAIEDANADPGSTIVFASALSGDAITLSGTELPQITAYSTTIQGPGADQLAIDGDFNSRIFNVSATDATISGLTIRNGTTTATPGGGIYLQAGNLTVQNSVVTGNTSDGGSGGGIYVQTGNLTVDSSTLSYNYATTGAGGGVGGHAGGMTHAGTTTIRNSTLSGNGANIGGGAYLSYNSPAFVENSTIYDNYTVGSGARGGGLYHAGQSGGPGLVVTGSTITENYSFIDGGGIAGSPGLPATYIRPTIRDSIVTANTVGTGGSGPDLYADTYSMDVGFSLIGTTSGVVISPTGPNIVGQDPQLGELDDNGGPTRTQKPATTSPAIDAGSAFGLTRDQRGQGRPFDAITANAAGGDASDIGAVELQISDIAAAPTPTTPTTPTTPATPTTPTKKKCKKKKKHKRSAESAKKKKCKKKKKKR
jgi:hypothetical protein